MGSTQVKQNIETHKKIEQYLKDKKEGIDNTDMYKSSESNIKKSGKSNISGPSIGNKSSLTDT